jgi:hypothetical protein
MIFLLKNQCELSIACHNPEEQEKEAPREKYHQHLAENICTKKRKEMRRCKSALPTKSRAMIYRLHWLLRTMKLYVFLLVRNKHPQFYY